MKRRPLTKEQYAAIEVELRAMHRRLTEMRTDLLNAYGDHAGNKLRVVINRLQDARWDLENRRLGIEKPKEPCAPNKAYF